MYYYKQDKNALEIDFFVRNTNSLIPIEVKASNAATASLTKLTSGNNASRYQDVRFGIKLCMANGWLVNSIKVENQINLYNKAEEEIKLL